MGARLGVSVGDADVGSRVGLRVGIFVGRIDGEQPSYNGSLSWTSALVTLKSPRS